MSEYVTSAELKLLGSMPGPDVEIVESKYPGVTTATIKAVSGHFDSKLIKRYGAPFTAPYPEALKLHVARVVAWLLWLKRGYNPTGKLDELLKADSDASYEWLKEAADTQNGLVELPGVDGPLGGSSATKASPLSYSETSPYVWTDVQVDAGRTEDSNRSGT